MIVKKVLVSVSVIILAVVLSLYGALNIYVSWKAVRIDPEYLKLNTKVELSEDQIEIISYIHTGEKKCEFKKNPVVAGLFLNRNRIAYLFADVYLRNCVPEHSRWTETEWRVRKAGTSRNAEMLLDSRTCCNYIYSCLYFGSSVYGLDRAAEFYFEKDYRSLTAEEFIKLVLLAENPVRYNFLDKDRQGAIGKKVDELLLALGNPFALRIFIV